MVRFRRQIRSWIVLLCMILVGGIVTSCAHHQSQPQPSISLSVFAAASLKPAFTQIGQRFEETHSGVHVDFNFAGSSTLASQLIEGAVADVFASANTTQMIKVIQDRGLSGNDIIFATNTLVIVTDPNNSHHITSLADLESPDISLVVCQEDVPCGAATQAAVQEAHVNLNPVSEESNVTDVLNKVITGQADAGIVYRTDALYAGDKVFTVTFAEAKHPTAINRYPIGQLANAPQPELAQQFIAMVTGPIGKQILLKAGFTAV